LEFSDRFWVTISRPRRFDRKLERMLTMLLRLKELRRTTVEG
jgi:hypothetical protein